MAQLYVHVKGPVQSMDIQTNMPADLKTALIIFAKHPVPGSVKTRLIPSFSPEEAAAFYRSMLLDTLAKTKELSGTARFLFYVDEPGAGQFFRDVAAGMSRLPQRGSNLGERMQDAFRQVFSEGYHSVVIIGTDSPDLPLNRIILAYERLANGETDLVFGPSEDGGYYLLGMKMLHPAIFSGVHWSSSKVFSESLRKAEEERLLVALLPEWHDVDQPEDLLRPELLDEANGAPLTRGFIRTLTNGRLHSPCG